MKRDDLDRIYQKYMKDVYRYLYSLCRDHHMTEDILQETFYRAYLHLENCKDDQVKPWLFRVAYHAFIDAKRKNKRTIIQDIGFFNTLSQPSTLEKQVMEQERWDELKLAIDELPEQQKQAILLYEFHQMSYQEASDLMKVGLSHFKILLFRARQKLRQQKGKGGSE
ncbi:RNA polymerase sigma-70 factor, ECF subfamily [Paenibacillus uliginis N3/975]|uniref:RNA polymerase sigma-70 factor, ECF subfamily n=1 Tax=Paenibacillus uliginis N3/975 TaxID=1313296 RepID=A0A1X7G620_9BACL|nr:sigma-70 family RNA polymerase sigma factor [Paenibacillus uliginis]SMF64674.1 RNA polymerase sigma-70 factor, ECF subfamily [Paenibacillus uliginis N3/975]